MIYSGKQLFALLDSILKREGFKRKNDTYYLNTKDCICFFTINKSRYHDKDFYDHVMGCFVKDLQIEKTEFPKFYTSHLKYTLDEFVKYEEVKKIFRLSNDVYKKNEREKAITDLIINFALPFLKDVGSKKVLDNLIGFGLLHSGL